MGGEPLGLENLWPQADQAKRTDLYTITQTDGLLTIEIDRDMTKNDGWNSLSIRSIRFDEPTWVTWTDESNAGTFNAIPDFTDHTKWACNPADREPKLLPAGTYDACVSLHLAKAGAYTCRPHLYRIPV